MSTRRSSWRGASRNITSARRKSRPSCRICSSTSRRRGRYRTNVWDYAGVNSFGSGRADLELHPTVKPVALIADAIRDCSNRKGIVLDPFGGSGSTLIAAHRTGRKARLIELDPHYADTIVRRWQDLTGGEATNSEQTRL